MGRSKFPGKPSKSVIKERIRVLYQIENESNEKIKDSSKNKKNYCERPDNNHLSLQSISKEKFPQYATTDIDSTNKAEQETQNWTADTNDSTVKFSCANGHNHKHYSGNILEHNEDKKVSPTGTRSGTFNSTMCKTGNTKCSLTELDKLIKKKTVTFRNILETSDDTSVVKSIHNPLNKRPLVSIMKKEYPPSQGLMTRADGIVRPSRLTEILKNNGNIDKTNALSFRSAQILNKLSDNSKKQKIDALQVNQHNSPIRECSHKIMFLDNEIGDGKFDLRNQYENVGKPEGELNEDNSNRSLDKWNLHKLCPEIESDTRDVHIDSECRKKSTKRKDNTVHNKIVLRQPRLHFEQRSDMAAKGKQSSLSHSNGANMAATNICTYLLCGVCNTAVNNKNLQNRKYGIIACDACRKFISKITKKTVSSSTNSVATFKVQCSKKDGECIISSLPKNNIKSFKKIYDERCSACWLKKCIKAFHFPSGHKLRLNAILSETEKKADLNSIEKPFDLMPSSSVNTFKYGKSNENDNANAALNSLNWREINNKSRPVESVQSRRGEFSLVNNNDQFLDTNLTIDLFSKAKQPSCFQSLCNSGNCMSGKHTRLYSNFLLNKESQPIHCKNVELQSTNPFVTAEYVRRQKVNFKGPRVKHVCRSASIALGQQIATFSNDDEEALKLQHSKSDIGNSSLTNLLLGNIYYSGNNQENYSQKTTKNVKQYEDGEDNLKQLFALNTVEGKTQPSKNPFATAVKNQIASLKGKHPVRFEKAFVYDRNNYQFPKSAQKYNENKNIIMLTRRNIRPLSKRNLMRITKAQNREKNSKIVYIDFSDSYIPAEVNQTGFGLILTEPTPVCALCFLCGSMDVDHLLFCASCCEPYHSYCVEDESNSTSLIFEHKNLPGGTENKNEYLNQLNWVCPRCTVCYTCNMSSGAKIKCQKCRKNYHSTCMGTSKGLLGADRPLICRNCLKCQTCSTTRVSKYVGNQPICLQCFKLRKFGNCCPLCNIFFDNTLDLIFLECGVCEKLIHAKCEGLTEEQSNLLSNIPGNIQFVCKKCSTANDTAKNLANKWRDAVHKELKTGLLDVLKLLSRSRQAKNLKKNTENNCLCGCDMTNKNQHIISFENYKNEYSNTKEGSAETNSYLLSDLVGSTLHSKCFCTNGLFQQSQTKNSLSLFDIKKKIVGGEYVSLFDFNADMNDVIMPLKNDELILAYKEILSEKFSWFQNETKTCTDALEEDMFETCNYPFQLDEIVTERQNTTNKLPDFVGNVVNSLNLETDNRVCQLCLKEGDGGFLQESRLLYYGYNAWVHVNCAIWSYDVYEEFDGTLQNLQIALNRGRFMKCSLCESSGATIKCIIKTCSSFYHFQCAIKAECVFKSDKTVYCSSHYLEEKDNNSPTKQMFSVCRPLYIEFDKSRRTYAEPCKIQFKMGSLSVVELGTVYSQFSDTSEAIVPINFICTRLYWSCREPWKIVKYSVRTSIQNSSATMASDIEKNFTVDHSENVLLVERGLTQIASWHNTLACEENLNTSLHKGYGHSNIRFPIDGDDYNETNLNICTEEEPQNNSDLLPPEIKDAIFEDLPHDILDGISMLDIFPKLMIYEDLITIEGKSDSMLITESVENCALQISENFNTFNSLNKQESSSRSSDNVMNQIEDTNTHTLHSICPKRELQRSNSEVFLRNVDGYRNQQRSSSVTWSCKFDNTRRYFAKGISDVGLSEARIYNSNYRKLESELDDYKSDSKKKVGLEGKNRLTQIAKDKITLMQLDGTDDKIMNYLNTHVQNAASNRPVKCDRCHCTYRTFDSFQRHLVSCEQISTSESETETSSRSPDASNSTTVFPEDTITNNLQLYHNQLASDQTLSANISIVISDPNVISPEQIIPQQTYVTNGANIDYNFYVDNNKTGKNNVDSKKSNSINILYDENSWRNNCNASINVFNKSIGKNKKVKCNHNFNNLNIKAKNEHNNFCADTKSEFVATSDTITTASSKTECNQSGKHSYLQFLNQQLVLNNNQYSQKEQQSQQQQFFVVQQSVGNNQPIFLQQISNTAPIPQNMFPVTFSNNSLQYTSIPTSASPLLQGSVLQSDASGNVILSSGLQMLSMPSLQMASQSSPHLVGAYNHPQSLHLGSNQMLIGSATTMELIPNANQVLLAAPPVYYGLETIVQNTVMSSQQFISTAMQGVLSQNASFSATTTQVFQSSKIEPVTDVPSGYVVVNNADGTSIVVPQTHLLSGLINTNSAHDFHSNYVQDFGNICRAYPQSFIQPPSSILPLIPTLSDMTTIPMENPLNQIQTSVNFESSSHIASPGNHLVTLASAANNSVLPEITSSLHISSQNSFQSSPICNGKRCDLDEIIVDTNDYGRDLIEPEIFEVTKKTTDVNKVCSRKKVQLEPKVVRKGIKRSRSAKGSQIGSKLVYKTILQKDFKLNKLKERVPDNLINKSEIGAKIKQKIVDDNYVQSLLQLNSNKTEAECCSENAHNDFEGLMGSAVDHSGLKDCIQNNRPRISNRPVSQLYMKNGTKSSPIASSFGNNFNNVPTNIVAPILQAHQSNKAPSRPTNRVLPMQAIHKPIDKSKLKTVTLKRPSIKDNMNKFVDTTPSSNGKKKKALPNLHIMEKKNNEILIVDQSVEVELSSNFKNMATLLKSKDEIFETTANVSHNIKLLEELPTLNDDLDLHKSAKRSNSVISLDNTDKAERNNLRDKINDDIIIKNKLSDELIEKSSISERLEVYTDTQLQKPSNQIFGENQYLDLSKNTGPSKSDFVRKLSEKVQIEHHSLTNSPPQISQFSSDNQIKDEDYKNISEPHLIYEIQSEDGFNYKSKSITEVWEKVFEEVQSARRAHGLSSLPLGPFADMCGVQMIGLKANALRYIIEQLPGTERCTKYTPKYHKRTSAHVGSEYIHQDQDELHENIYGAVRCEPFTRRSDYDLFSWLASRHRKQPKQIFVQPSDTELIARRCTVNLPMAMKYRTLKETCKYNVGVFRSLIHGRGLFCTKDIEAGEMVIEYAGELIRSTLTDKRERSYDSRGIGCYMFKIDDNFVVDATMRGNAARFINHSCEPNCYSKVVDILGHKHIIIFSLRRIVQGEELTYDYKFPFEDVKIPCSCGSKKCRKYLN